MEAASLRRIVSLSISLALCLASLPLAAGCTQSGAVPVYPVTGELFVRSQPAIGALVILRPAGEADPAAWPMGFPRAVVQPEGTFQVSTFGTGDGAPAGEYVVLVEWKPPLDADADPEAANPDRLGGRYMDPATSKLTATVLTQPTELPRIDLE